MIHNCGEILSLPGIDTKCRSQRITNFSCPSEKKELWAAVRKNNETLSVLKTKYLQNNSLLLLS